MLQIIAPSLSWDSEQWVTFSPKHASITKYSRGELKMAFQPLTEFPIFLQFTPDPYSYFNLSFLWQHTKLEVQKLLLTMHTDMHKHTTMNYCTEKLSAPSLIKCLFSERLWNSLFHTALDQAVLAANTQPKHLDWTDSAPLARVNNSVNPVSNCKSLYSQMAFWRIFFFLHF